MRSFRFVVTVLLLLSAAMAFAAGGTETATTGEKMEITWMGHPHSYEAIPADGNPTELLLEERFDVEIIPAAIAINENEKVMLYFAEGKTADMINIFGDGVGRELIDQGLVRSIPEDWLWKYLPDWMGDLIDVFGEARVREELGRYDAVYGAPGGNYSWTNVHVALVRQDWMDAVGVKDPKTLDDFFDMFKKFTFDDPDGNGKDDTYGIGMYNWSKFQYILGAYGVGFDRWYVQDGKGAWSCTLQGYRDALSLLNSWYDAGIMDPEFVTDSRDDFRKKWSEGKLGYNVDHPWWMAASTPNNVTSMVTDRNPDARLTLLTGPTGPAGTSGIDAGKRNMFGQVSMLFGRNTSDEKVLKIMEIKNGLSKDMELYTRSYHGVEGTHWDKVDGIITYKPADDVSSADRSAFGLGQFYALVPATFEKHAMPTLSPLDVPFYEMSGSQNIINSAGFADTTEIVEAKLADVQTIATEYFFKFIRGDVDINSNTAWNDYIAALNKAGLDQLMEEYERQMLK